VLFEITADSLLVNDALTLLVRAAQCKQVALSSAPPDEFVGRGTFLGVDMKPLADERRLVSRVLRHWRQRARDGRRYPSVYEIDPWLVGNDWESCSLIKLDPSGAAYFLTVGSALAPDDTATLESNPIASCPPNTVLAAALNHLPRCVAGEETVSIEGTASHKGTSVLFRAVLLPLSEDGAHPDGVFGAANYRAMVSGDEITLRTRSKVRMLDVSVGQLWEVFDATIGWQRMVVLSVEGEQAKLMSKQNYVRHAYPINDMTTQYERFRFVGQR
jgi:hypothetical protein